MRASKAGMYESEGSFGSRFMTEILQGYLSLTTTGIAEESPGQAENLLIYG
jgi:hypothetical protein